MKSVIIFMLLLPLASATPGKVLLFPAATDTSYVTVTPLKPLDLKAFTLCMRVASELSGKREVILFAYRVPEIDELNIWRELDGSFSLYLHSCHEKISFSLPQLNIFQTHMCVTWESSTGLGAFWVDGRRSISKVYKPGYSVQPGGIIYLGQDPDSYNNQFDKEQSFVGEITDANMWDRVLTENEIKALYQKSWVGDKGNIINWIDVQYKVHGNVIQH